MLLLVALINLLLVLVPYIVMRFFTSWLPGVCVGGRVYVGMFLLFYYVVLYPRVILQIINHCDIFAFIVIY